MGSREIIVCRQHYWVMLERALQSLAQQKHRREKVPFGTGMESLDNKTPKTHGENKTMQGLILASLYVLC